MERKQPFGELSQKKKRGAKSTKIYLKHCNLRVEEKQLPCRQILVYLNTDVSVGNIIYVNGTVKTLEPARNEGNFDEKNFYESQGTDFKFYGENVQFISRDTDRFAEFLYQKKREVIQLYQKTMGAETAGVLSTMVLGRQTAVRAGDKEPLSKDRDFPYSGDLRFTCLYHWDGFL